MRTALLSVYHKEGIKGFAQSLVDLGWSIVASGGTAKMLESAGIPVRDVATLVGGGAILGHRVVTLSREVHAGLLAQDTEADRKELGDLGIPWIDMVCVDLYPLQEEINNPDHTLDSVIEKTDIGGPTMLRSAAKGRRIVVCDPADRPSVIHWLIAGQPNREEYIGRLAAKAEFVIANYCLASARELSGGVYDGVIGRRVLGCKYGENAHQQPAALYTTDTEGLLALDKFQVIAGTPSSYNNLCDIDRMLQTATHIAAAFAVNRSRVPFVAIGVKHGNPCGAAVGESQIEVVRGMISGDTRAIFGGFVLTNFPITEDVAEELLTYLMPPGERRLLDGIVAPYFAPESLEMLRRKGDKCRLLIHPDLSSLKGDSLDFAPRFRYVRGGFLRQPNYGFVLNLADQQLVKTDQLSQENEDNLLLAWAIGSTSNSNTITLVTDGRLIGNGVGQQDRVGGCQLAINRAVGAGHESDIEGAVAYSDSFFPFLDGPETLARVGVKAVMASSGSVQDKNVMQFCRDNGMVMYLIPDSVGRGFFGH